MKIYLIVIISFYFINLLVEPFAFGNGKLQTKYNATEWSVHSLLFAPLIYFLIKYLIN